MPLQYALTEYRSDKEKLLALFDTLVSLQPSLTVDGVSLTQQDIQDLLNQTEGLALLKGKWIEVNHEKLKKLLVDMKNVPENLSFREAMQLEIADSGKFELLKELCETIYEKRERVIVFTQFKEITEYLADYLTGIFHAKGYVIHGGTPVKRRAEIVDAFQGERYVPFIVLSVKAAGPGLNLTRANHVIHFDRWWNSAVENQATDRAFRIGQTKDVMVHKLVSQGTIEEKIDQMIHSKKELAENMIGSGSEKWITELSNEELFSLLRLESR